MSEQTPLGGLGQMREAAYSGAPLRDSMDTLLGMPVIDPSAKWHAYVAGALKPTWGGFGASMSNALGAYSDAQQKEAELRAKYVPLVAQAMLQRQLQSAQLAKQQFELTQQFDNAGVGALTGLLSRKEPITNADVASTLGNLVARGMMPADYARTLYATLPQDDPKNPELIRGAIQRMAIARLNGQDALAAVTPKVEPTSTGAGTAFPNINPNAPVPVGLGVGAPVQKTLAPGERYKVEKDPAGNSYIVDLESNTKYYPGAPSQAQPSPISPAAPPKVPPGVAGAPQNTSVTAKAFDEDTGKKVAAYAEDLGGSLDALRNVQLRLTEMKDLVKNFQTGASAEYRLKAGAWLRDLGVSLGLSPKQADTIGESMAKGDIGSAQAFQKLAVQGTLDILKAANPRFTQAEFGVLAQNNPNLMLDPASLDKMMNFMTRQYLFKSAEQREFNAFREGGGDLRSWNAAWDARSRELGFIKPLELQGVTRGSSTKASELPVTNTRSGKTARLTDKGWVYE